MGAYITYAPVDQNYGAWEQVLFSEVQMNDDMVTSIVMDFCLYNGDEDMVIYVFLKFIFFVGGNVSVDTNAYPMRINLYSTPLDYFRACLEVLMIASIVYQISLSIKLLAEKSLDYDNWWGVMKTVLSEKEKKARKRIKPNQVRKFEALVDIYLILDFVFYTLTLGMLFIWGAMVVSLYMLKNGEDTMVIKGSLDMENEDFFQTYNMLSNVWIMYYKVAGCAAMVLLLRLLQYATLNKAMSFIQITMGHAYKDLFFFLGLFATLVFGFTMLGYVGLGRSSPRYNTVIQSFMGVFEMILGVFYWDETVRGDRYIGPIFIIMFMLMFMYVYANVFISILEIAYRTFRAEKTNDDATLPDPLSAIFVYCVGKCKKKRKKDKLKINENYDRIDGLENEIFFPRLEKSPYFGNYFAEYIINERRKRNALIPEYRKVINAAVIPEYNAKSVNETLRLMEYLRRQFLIQKDHLDITKDEVKDIEIAQRQRYDLEQKTIQYFSYKYVTIQNMENDVEAQEIEIKGYLDEIKAIEFESMSNRMSNRTSNRTSNRASNRASGIPSARKTNK